MTASFDEARRFLKLASDDFAAFRALAATPHIRQAIAIFHVQQAIEKNMKAVLFTLGAEFRRTHESERGRYPLSNSYQALSR